MRQEMSEVADGRRARADDRDGRPQREREVAKSLAGRYMVEERERREL